MGQAEGGWLTLAQYVRRLDGFEYRRQRTDLPHDSRELLRLAESIDLGERIIVDAEDNSD